MSDQERFASSFDKEVDSAIDEINRWPVVPPQGKDKQHSKGLENLFKKHAEAVAKRSKSLDEQDKIVEAHFKDPGFGTNMWRLVAWVDKDQLQKDLAKPQPKPAGQAKPADKEPQAMPMEHRNGGHFSVKPGEIVFNDAAASSSFELLDMSMQHVKKAWGGVSIQITGDEKFKDISWALAQKHGIKVENFIPADAVNMTDKERKELAERWIAKYQKDNPEPKRPSFLSWPDMDLKLAA